MHLRFKKRKLHKVSNVIPRPIVIIFALILVLSTYSLFRDLNQSGLRPFGMFNDVFANFLPGSNISSKAASEVVSNDYKIIDSWGRCLITNPNSNPPVQTVADAGFSTGIEANSKGGLNQGQGFGDTFSQIDFIRSAGLNMTYILGLTTDPGETGGAVAFIKAANEAGRMPIIRLCFIGGCNFNLSGNEDQIVNFYTAINNSLAGTDAEYIAVLGPNEPGTGEPREANGFFPGTGLADMPRLYPILVQRANDAATRLQNERVENGGHMYLAPAIFNSNNTENDDVKAYLYSSNPIQPDLFDFILTNAYNMQNGTAPSFYDQAGRSIRQYVEENGLYTIFTEFGYMPNSGGEAALKTSYDTLCNDDTVDGILFFRPSYPELPVGSPRQEPPIDSTTLKAMINGCSKEPQKINARSSSWLNCNFDSCVSKEYKYSSRSIARPLTPVILTGSGTTNNGSDTVDIQCNPNAYNIYSSNSILEIGAGNKDQSKVILIGDSLTFEDPYPNAINIGQPGASTYWFLGNDPIDPNNPSKSKAKAAFENSLTSNAFAALIMMGSNDCGGVPLSNFQSNLTAIARRYASSGIIPILSTFPERNIAIATAKGLPGCESTTDSFNAAIRSIASLNQWPLRDGNQMVDFTDLKEDGLHINNYTCLNTGSTNLLNKLRGILGGSPLAGGADDIPTVPAPTENNANLSAWLKINCNGGGCNAKQINTTQAWLPIKSLGSTTATNSTLYRTYTPACAELATQVHSDEYDLLNQFAGKLSSGDTIYPMPWLGSLINCISEMSNFSKDFAGDLQIQSTFKPHPFSKNIEAKAETPSDISRNLAKSPDNLSSVDEVYKILKDTNIFIPDEKSVCIQNNTNGVETCYDNSAINSLKIYRAYDAFSVPDSWYSVNYKTSSNIVREMIYLKNNDDLLPGPEVNAGNQTFDFSASDLCRRFGIRQIDDDTKRNFRFNGALDCTVNPTAVFEEVTISVGPPKRTQKILCGSRITNQELKSLSYLNGNLTKLKDVKYSNCFDYHPQGELIEYKTQNYANVPKYNIEGIYDALHKQYVRLQNQMSSRNKKIVFKKDIGWTGTLDSIIRDGNRPIDLGEYLFKGEYDNAICENVDFFDNKTAKARGSAVKKTNVYYSQVGALEPMQEWIDIYVNSTNLPGEKILDNPFYDLSDNIKPNNDKKSILVAGLASTINNFPLLSCDQVKICELYTNEDLYSTLRQMQKYTNKSDQELQTLAKEICPFTNKIPKDQTVACIADRDDFRYSDSMSEFLCRQGYSITGVCNAGENPDIVPGSGGLQCTIDGSIINSSAATCPIQKSDQGNIASNCIQGPYGTLSHACLNSIDLPGDTLVAPFDGRIISASSAYAYCKDGGTAGGAIFFKGTFLGKEIVLFFYHIVVPPGLEGKTFSKGEFIARTALPGDPGVTSTGCLGSPQHSHVELSNDSLVTNQPGDILGMFYAMGCRPNQLGVPTCELKIPRPTAPAQCSAILQQPITSPIACTTTGGEETGPGVAGGCNEWNCDSKTTFQESLMCIAGLSYIKRPTDEFVDIYGPFCDNETYAATVLPFAHNFARFYDTYLPPGSLGGRTCGELPPSTPREGDRGMDCPAFSIRYGTEPYNYYRGALMRCGIPESQRGWTSNNTFGINDPEQLADYLMNTLNVSYSGLFLKNTPRVKVVEVLKQAKAKNINPFMLLGTWGTESWFGQYNARCNIIP